MNTYNNSIKPKSPINEGYNYTDFQEHISCSYNSFKGEDVVKRFVLGTQKKDQKTSKNFKP